MSKLSLASAQVSSAAVADPHYPQALLAQNILAHSGIALLLVDSKLVVRFFTPAAVSSLPVPEVEGEVSLSAIQDILDDLTLVTDVQAIFQGLDVKERKLHLRDGRCFLRRLVPYRTAANTLDGVIVIFTDGTHQDHVTKELTAARQQAELASAASLRWLAIACHDLREPMNTLGLVGGLLAQSFRDPIGQRLAQQLDQTLQAMSGMISSVHYGYRLSAGTLQPELRVFCMNEILVKLRREFAYHAAARGLALRILPCNLAILSDPTLLEQLLRSLLEHVVRIGRRKAILGCRRKRGTLSIEFWCARESQIQELSAGPSAPMLPSGSEIAEKLSDLLGYRLQRSPQGKPQLVYTIEIPTASQLQGEEVRGDRQHDTAAAAPSADSFTDVGISSEYEQAVIFVIDDDEEVCRTLMRMLSNPGWTVETYQSAEAFLGAYTPRNPSCLLVDACLSGMHGIELIQRLNAAYSRPPTIVMSGRGDIAVAVEAMKAGAMDFVEKPLDSTRLRACVERAMAESQQLHKVRAEQQQVSSRVASLTARQKQVLQLMLDGKSNKMIAAQLSMSRRTVECHRANAMKKMRAKSLPELARMISIARPEMGSRKTGE